MVEGEVPSFPDAIEKGAEGCAEGDDDDHEQNLQADAPAEEKPGGKGANERGNEQVGEECLIQRERRDANGDEEVYPEKDDDGENAHVMERGHGGEDRWVGFDGQDLRAGGGVPIRHVLPKA